MPHYKNTAGAVYWLDNDNDRYFLPADCVPITDAEADALRAPPAPTPAQIIEAENAAALEALELIDKKSIRSIREWILTQPNPPAFLVDFESQAVAQRAKIK